MLLDIKGNPLRTINDIKNSFLEKDNKNSFISSVEEKFAINENINSLFYKNNLFI